MGKTLLVLSVLLVGTAANADSWAQAQPESVFSEDGSRFARITPGESVGETAGFAGAPRGEWARAELYVRTAGRSYERIAHITLRNPVAPVKTMMTNAGYLITFDNWHNMGYGEVITVFDPQGKLVRSYRLEEMYDQEDAGRVPTSVSSRWWRCNPMGFVDPDAQTQIYISEFRGGNFVLTVASGDLRYEAGKATCSR